MERAASSAPTDAAEDRHDARGNCAHMPGYEMLEYLASVCYGGAAYFTAEALGCGQRSLYKSAENAAAQRANGAAAVRTVRKAGRQTVTCIARRARMVLNPVIIPIGVVASAGRASSINTLARTLPSVAKQAEPALAASIEKTICEMDSGGVDPNELLVEGARRLYELDVTVRGEGQLIETLRIDLFNVARTIAKDIDGGHVSKLAMDVEADIEVFLRPGALRLGARSVGRCCLPSIHVEPAHLRFSGPMRVWWDTREGVLSLIFVEPPVIDVDLHLGLSKCCTPPQVLVAAALRAGLAVAMPRLFTEEEPLRLPIRAPVALRITDAVDEDENSLSHLHGQIKHSANVLRAIAPMIPKAALKRARGIAFVTHVKGGLGATVAFGTGLVIRRCASGAWSAPASIGSTGFGVGANVGAAVTDTVLLLQQDSAVRMFMGKGQVSLPPPTTPPLVAMVEGARAVRTAPAQVRMGADVVVAAGPIGAEVTAGVAGGPAGAAAILSYSRATGIFVGTSLGGEIFVPRNTDNEDYYGVRGITPRQVLEGLGVRRPSDGNALALYAALDDAFG